MNILDRILKRIYNRTVPTFARDYKDWVRRRYAAPSPDFIKRERVVRNGIPNVTWVETGTCLGTTTRVLAKSATMVYSIEPEPTLFANAEKLFESADNVEIIKGTSETIFPTLLPKITGDVNFWLDGHYSAGVTYKGPKDTPICEELESISKNLSHFKKVTILVDDVRCFNPQIADYSSYPPIDFLVDWARAKNFSWYIEHDVFVCKNY